MKFTYQFKTSDGIRHGGECVAANREAVFTALKSKGIRPFDVKLAPGIFNRVASIGKRGLAIAVLAVLLVLAVVLGFVLPLAKAPVSADEVMLNAINSSMRRQVIGDAAVIDQGIRTGWATVFSEPGDRFLASYAVPGVIGGVATTTVEQVQFVLEGTSEGYYAPDSSSLSLEGRQIVAMVGGIKDELRDFLAAGGSIRQFCRLLIQRQEKEIGYYQKAKGEVEHAAETFPQGALDDLVEKRNAALRHMGIRTLVIPRSKMMK